jgi:hypothetical protein
VGVKEFLVEEEHLHRIKGMKRKHSLIEHNITRDIDTPSRNFETLYSLVARTITEKRTLCGAEG